MSTKALLEAAKARKRLSHPLARYTTAGQLQCLVCQCTIKTEVLWASHLASKSHRLYAEQARANEARRQAATGYNSSSDGTASVTSGDIAAVSTDDQAERTPLSPAKPIVPAAAPDGIDPDEWARFNAEVLAAPDSAPDPAHQHQLPEDHYIISAPAILTKDVAETEQAGRPSLPAPSAEALAEKAARESAQEAERVAKEEAEARRRRQEDREEFLARLDEEAFEQEAADARVAALKAKREALRARSAAKRQKTSPLAL